VAQNFSYTQACTVKLHQFCKKFFFNGTALHQLATLFNNTNAVSKPEHGDKIVHDIVHSANHLRNPVKFTAKLQIILPKHRTAEILQIFFIKRFTLTMDPILIVLLKLVQAKLEIQTWEGQAPREKSGGA